MNQFQIYLVILNLHVAPGFDHREIFAADDKQQGQRSKAECRGIHVHNTEAAARVEDYVCFTPLCNDGVMWAASWEVKVDRSQEISKKGNGEWIQAPGSVRMFALWLCGLRYEEMPNNVEVSKV